MVFPPLLKNKSVLIAIALAMAISAAGTISSIYAYSIVLSNYPTAWLIYYIVLQAFFTSLVRAVGLLFLTQDIKKSTLQQFTVFTIVFIICIFAMKIHLFAIPFIVATIVSGIPSLCTILTWSILSCAFGMREYKTIAGYINQASYASAIISSFLVPLLVLFFSNISLLIFTTFMFFLSGVFIYKLPVLEQETTTKKTHQTIKSKKIKYPLYRYMLFFAVAVATSTGIAQYLLKLEAATYFTREELSAFLGLFSGITNFIGLGVAFTSRWFAKYLGLEALLYSEPLCSFFGSLLVIISPSLWSVTILGSTRNIFGYSYGAYSNEITLNILPPQVRVVAKAKIKSTANIASTLLLLVFAFGKPNIRDMALWIPLISLTAIYLTFKIKKYYKITLQQESAFKRYNILDEIIPETEHVFKDIALNSIQSTDPYTIFYGLDLLYRLKLAEPPKEVYTLLSHHDHTIRYAVINFLIQANSKEVLPFLEKQLALESDDEIKYTMIEGLACIDLNSAINAANKLPNKIYETILLQLFSYINTGGTNESVPSLMVLTQHPDPLIRKMMAFLIGAFNITELSESLGILIKDEDKGVSDEAINSAGKARMMILIPQIISELIERKVAYTAHLALVSLGVESLPYLFSEVFNIKTTRVCLRTITTIPGPEADQMLIDILKKENYVYYRTMVAKYANDRACKFTVSDEFKTQANQLAQEEVAIIFHLKNLHNSATDKQIQLEIKLRIEMAKIRFLQWIAISTWTREINKLLIHLMQPGKSTARSIGDKALELLEIYLRDKNNIRDCVNYILEDKKLAVIPAYPTTYQDPWLEQIMNEADEKSPLLSIVFELRAVRLFKDLPAEILLAIAEEVEYCSFSSGELIFAEHDIADGLYCISHGEVTIIRNNKEFGTISEHGFFGELALLDEATRVASAVAKTDCSLLFIEKEVFNRISDDVPDVLRTVVKIILEYLRKNLEQAH